MKLLESNDHAILLELTRAEFHVVRDGNWEAIRALIAYVSTRTKLAEELEGGGAIC